MRCSMLQHVAAIPEDRRDHVLQCVIVCRSVLQCVAVCCNALQCVAACCSDIRGQERLRVAVC